MKIENTLEDGEWQFTININNKDELLYVWNLFNMALGHVMDFAEVNDKIRFNPLNVNNKRSIWLQIDQLVNLLGYIERDN